MTAHLTAPPSPQTAAGKSLSAMPCCALRVLRLTLKRKWFDMIASGEKLEEYRTPGKWILSRLEGKEYDRIEFKNGYGPDVPCCVVEYLGYDLATGNPAWGAVPGTLYKVIRLGRVISLHNVPAQTPTTGASADTHINHQTT